MLFEVLLILALLAGGVAAGLVVKFHAHQSLLTAATLGCLGLTIVGGAVATWSSEGRDQANSEETVRVRPRQLPADGYVGSQSCKSCHPHNHATWHDSYHRTMTQVATPKSVIGDFDNVDLQDDATMLTLTRDGDQFLAAMPFQSPLPVVMTTGSHNMQVYWVAPQGNTRLLAQLPFVWLKEEARWIPTQASFLTHRMSHSFQPGQWNAVCIKCHTTHGRVKPPKGDRLDRPDELVLDTQAAEFGISCEACHGPGKRHVEANQNVVGRYQRHLKLRNADTIINPAKLSHQRSSQVCGRCHAVWEPRGSEKSHWLEHGHDFRPGDDLFKTRTMMIVRGDPKSITPEERDLFKSNPHFYANSFWPDGMIRVSGREYSGLRNNPCYKRGTMSCLTCHRMHQAVDDPRPRREWANDQLMPRMNGNHACIQCHPRFGNVQALTEHTHHAADSAGSSCYNCHMSYTTYGLLKAIRSHQIDSPNVATSLKTGRPNACNQCHLDRTLQWTSNHLKAWYGVQPPTLPEDERERAASVLRLLKGDAGQRALMAWSYGWTNAHEASGRDWQAPFLGQLLNDPYPAVRLIAHRSLRRIPGFENFEYDCVASAQQRLDAQKRVMTIWLSTKRANRHDDAILIGRDGRLDRATFDRLSKMRNDRPVDLME